MTFEIPVKTVSESNQREHWAAKHRRTKALRETAAMFSGQWRSKAPKRIKAIRMTRVTGKRGKMLDVGNLAVALKAVQDGLCDALGIDDGDARIEWTYDQCKGDDWGVEVEIS